MKIIWRESTGSTNDDAKNIARALTQQGVRDEQWTGAEIQTAGRGRGDRKWESPKGNLYASWVGRLPRPMKEVAQASFVASLAVFETTKHFMPQADLTFKWPNDVLIEGKKFCGILLEIEGDWLIVGIGVNLRTAPKEALYPAAALGLDLPPQTFLEKLAEHFDRLKAQWQEEGFEPLRSLWLSHAQGLGEEIKVRLPTKEIEGKFVALNARGALELAAAQGKITIEAGDVFFN